MAGVESDWVRHLAGQVDDNHIKPVVFVGGLSVYVHPEIPFGWSHYDATFMVPRIVIGRDTWLTLGYDSRSQWDFFDLVKSLPAGVQQHDVLDGPLADAVRAKALLEPTEALARSGADRVEVLKTKARDLLRQATSINDHGSSRERAIFAREMARLNEEVTRLHADVADLVAMLDSVNEAYV